MAMLNITIGGRTFFAAIAAEVVVIGIAAWIGAGVPGMGRDAGPPSVTIQFAPVPEPASPVRAYRI